MRKITLLLFALLPLFCRAQVSLYEKAMIVTSVKDTFYGKVRMESEQELSNSCLFQSDNGTEKKYSPGELHALFLFNDSIWYEPVDYQTREDGNTLTIKRMARVVCKGYISLYKLEVPSGTYSVQEALPYVFIVRKESKDYVLPHAIYSSSPKFNKYKGVLRYLLQEGKIPGQEFEKLPYNEIGLTQILKKYSLATNHAAAIVYNSKSKTYLSAQLKLGGIFIPTYRIDDNLKLKNGTGYSIGASLDVLSPAESKFFLATVEAAYFRINWPNVDYIDYKGVKSTLIVEDIKGWFITVLGTYKISTGFISPLFHAGFSLELSNAQRMRPYIDLGLGMKIKRFNTRLEYNYLLGFKNSIGGNWFQLKLGYAFLETKPPKNQ